MGHYIMPQSLTTVQGNSGELLVQRWLNDNGFNVFLENANNSEYDIVAEKNGHLIPIQVKTCLEIKDGTMTWDLRRKKSSNSSYDSTPIFALVCIENEYVGCAVTDQSAITFRIDDPISEQKVKINWASEMILTRDRLFQLNEKLLDIEE